MIYWQRVSEISTVLFDFSIHMEGKREDSEQWDEVPQATHHSTPTCSIRCKPIIECVRQNRRSNDDDKHDTDSEVYALLTAFCQI